MPPTEAELLSGRAEDATESDKVVLALLSRRHSKITSVQKIGLLLHAVFVGKVPKEFSPHFFGGFSDELDHSLEDLQECGYVFSDESGAYSLTPAGRKLLADYLTDPDSVRMKTIAEKIVSRFATLSDQEILQIMYEMFPELTGNSLIKGRVAKPQRIRNIQIATIPH
jgi:hypothetical protein